MPKRYQVCSVGFVKRNVALERVLMVVQVLGVVKLGLLALVLSKLNVLALPLLPVRLHALRKI
jgi:hypothetical protein